MLRDIGSFVPCLSCIVSDSVNYHSVFRAASIVEDRRDDGDQKKGHLEKDSRDQYIGQFHDGNCWRKTKLHLSKKTHSWNKRFQHAKRKAGVDWRVEK